MCVVVAAAGVAFKVSEVWNVAGMEVKAENEATSGQLFSRNEASALAAGHWLTSDSTASATVSTICSSASLIFSVLIDVWFLTFLNSVIC